MDHISSCKISISHHAVGMGTIEFFNCRYESYFANGESIFVSWTPDTGFHTYVTKLWQDGVPDMISIGKISQNCQMDEEWVHDQVLALANMLHARYGNEW